MNDQQQAPEISYEVRVKPGRAGTDPEAPDWEVVELEDGEIKNSADIYDNMTQAEANQIAGMWRRKKEEADARIILEFGVWSLEFGVQFLNSKLQTLNSISSLYSTLR